MQHAAAPFARFETLFQLVWVIGALLAVVLEPSLARGLAALAVGFGVTAVLYPRNQEQRAGRWARSRRSGEPSASPDQRP